MKKYFTKWSMAIALGLGLSTNLAASYQVETIAGSSSDADDVDGRGNAARFSLPQMLSIDSSGNLYVPDVNRSLSWEQYYPIRKITTSGSVYNVSTLGYVSHGLDFPATTTTLYKGNILVADSFGSIGIIDEHGNKADIRSGSWGYNAANFVVDAGDNIYFTDSGQNYVGLITSTGAVSTFVNGLNAPQGITMDTFGNLYVTNSGDNTIKKITPTGTISTIAGISGSSGSVDGDGLTAATFNNPLGIAIDASGNLYVADQGNNTIRKLTNNAGTYSVSTIAGLAGSSGSSDGIGSAARFNAPTGLAVDVLGYIYVSDTNNNTIRKLFCSVEVDFTTGAHFSGPVTGEIKFVGNDSDAVCTFDGSATQNVQVTKGKISMSSSAPIATGAYMHLNGGNLIVTTGGNVASLAMDQDGALEVQTTDAVNLTHLIGSGELAIESVVNSLVTVTTDLSAETAGGINVNHGEFHVNNGKTPVAPLKIANGVDLRLTSGQVSSSLTVDTGGVVAVDAGKKVGAALVETTTYSFDVDDGYFKSGSDVLPWPVNLTGFNSGPNDIAWAPVHPWNTSWASWWSTNDTTDQGLTYGGVPLTFWNITGDPLAAITGNFVYFFTDGDGLAAHPTISVPTDNDVALVGDVGMQGGSSINLGAGATWARNITVFPATA